MHQPIVQERHAAPHLLLLDAACMYMFVSLVALILKETLKIGIQVMCRKLSVRFIRSVEIIDKHFTGCF